MVEVPCVLVHLGLGGIVFMPEWLSTESSGWSFNVLESKQCIWHDNGVFGFLVNAAAKKGWSRMVVETGAVH